MPKRALPTDAHFASLLRELNIEKYGTALAEEDIHTAEDLRHLSPEDVRQIGFKIGARNRVLKWAAEAREAVEAKAAADAKADAEAKFKAAADAEAAATAGEENAAADAEAATAAAAEQAEAGRVAAEETTAEEMMPLGGGSGVAGAASPGGASQVTDTLFASLDKDGDGHIDASEMDAVVPGASAILSYLDKDGDGRVSKVELAAGLSMAVAGLHYYYGAGTLQQIAGGMSAKIVLGGTGAVLLAAGFLVGGKAAVGKGTEAAFSAFDKDGDGVISAGEAPAGVGSAMAYLDQAGDGKLFRAELLAGAALLGGGLSLAVSKCGVSLPAGVVGMLPPQLASMLPTLLPPWRRPL